MRNSLGQFTHGSKHLLKHGKAKQPIYNLWSGMRYRCENPKCPAYPNYGGRGITVCERWKSFENFYEDMGERPAGMSLDRIDNDAGYSPGNCRWASRKQQARNQRGLKMLTIGNATKPLCEWADESPVSLPTIWARLKNGWEPSAAVFSERVSRKGIPRGSKLRDFQKYGARHGVVWSEPMPIDRAA